MRETIQDKINAWFVENRHPETGEYPDFPAAEDGGCALNMKTFTCTNSMRLPVTWASKGSAVAQARMALAACRERHCQNRQPRMMAAVKTANGSGSG